MHGPQHLRIWWNTCFEVIALNLGLDIHHFASSLKVLFSLRIWSSVKPEASGFGWKAK